jgi:flagellar biosynthesis/type III secretory pathway M-ring protein FliF/YscJ
VVALNTERITSALVALDAYPSRQKGVFTALLAFLALAAIILWAAVRESMRRKSMRRSIEEEEVCAEEEHEEEEYEEEEYEEEVETGLDTRRHARERQHGRGSFRLAWRCSFS